MVEKAIDQYRESGYTQYLNYKGAICFDIDYTLSLKKALSGEIKLKIE